MASKQKGEEPIFRFHFFILSQRQVFKVICIKLLSDKVLNGWNFIPSIGKPFEGNGNQIIYESR